MGFRTLFKGLRVSDRKKTSSSSSPSSSATGTGGNEGISTATSNSTLQPGLSISGVGITGQNDDNTPRDLWDEAYTNLSRDDPKLKQMYEDIILIEGEGNDRSGQKNLGWSLNILLSHSFMHEMTGFKRLPDHINVKSSYGK
jgi:hypothetical protein